MSLINQMLQDLEKRGEDDSSHAATHYAQFGGAISPSISRKIYGYFLLLLIIVVGGVFFFVFYPKQLTKLSSTPPEKMKTFSNLTATLANPVRPIEVVTPDAGPAMSELSLHLKLSTQVDTENLNETNESRELSVRAKDNQGTSGWSEVNRNPANAVIKQDLQNTLSLNKQIAAESKSSVISANSKKAASTTIVANTEPVTMIKEVSVQQRAEGEYRQATTYQQQGRTNEALAALENALKTDPAHAPARQLLISLLLENKRYDEAIRELRQGLLIDPAQLNFSMILARLLVERAKLSEAIDVLQKNVSLAQDRPDFLAFLAALQQKTNHHKEAISLYRQALNKHSQNGSWWMGLGISLQAEAHSQEAIDAYKQAKLQPGLSAELHMFIDQRISQLQK